MKVISTNIGNPTKIVWNGKEQQTGIYKSPISGPIDLERENVLNDTVSDRRVHGGVYMACYLFSADNYSYWKNKYPDLSWDWGMFGENLTVEGLDESLIRIGNIYKIGTALVKITQPREPCFKLGIRFGNQKILHEFIEHGCPGVYVQVLKSGTVKVGDNFILEKESDNVLSIKQLYELLYAKEKDRKLIALALANEDLPPKKRKQLLRFVKMN
ncbi:MOSC domain-containing protein [Dokdonia sp.]|uniref:MOSC domain-containing protein n=1 Tax=Dokdonia sp. TaxID=2024995 RepID=UPI0032648863